jgi:hypothetical protein
MSRDDLVYGRPGAYVEEDSALIERVQALLEEWAECQRKEPGIANLDWPGETIESRMRREHARRGDKSERKYRMRRPRRVDMGTDAKGQPRTVPAVDMVPEHVPRQTQVMRTPRGPDWPDHVMELERILAAMPRRLLRALQSRYLYRDSLRIGAEMMGVSMNRYRLLISQGEWCVAGRLLDVESG